jgi:adenosylcobinamide-GDP ribazoletransferase
MSLFGNIAAAFGWLSIVPVTPRADSRPARWFPLVGWLFGGIGAAMAWIAGRLGVGVLGALLTGALVMAVWAAMSRLLHWDGVADTADGLLGGHDPERRLEIMHDSLTGAFGAAAIVIGMLLQALALGALVASGEIWGIIAAPVLGRFAATAGLWTLRPARAEGLAAQLAIGEGWLAWMTAIAICTPLLLAFTPIHAIIVLTGFAAAVIVPRMLARPVGGISGDLLGASVVIVEVLVLVISALSAGV